MALLAYDLVYGTREFEECYATDIARLFCQEFAAGARYFTNAHVTNRGLVSAQYLMEGSTLDAGVLAIGPHGAGLIWVGDED